MASERSNTNTNRPLKPTLASTRTARTPITPRVAGSNATPSSRSAGSRATPTIQSEPPNPKAKQPTTPIKDVFLNGNVTPRSSARASRPGSANASPAPVDSAKGAVRPRLAAHAVGASAEVNGKVGSSGASNSSQGEATSKRPRSFISDNGSTQSPLSRPFTFSAPGPKYSDESIDSKFFHAGDVQKPEAKKAQFFHADRKEELDKLPPNPVSPVLSAIGEKRSAGPWIRSGNTSPQPKSPPLLSPAFSGLSGVSSSFGVPAAQTGGRKSPSHSKENIHLSYRKGVSQIIGTRPIPEARSTISDNDLDSISENEHRRSSLTRHQVSPSPVSIDPVSAPESRRRSLATDPTADPTTGTRETKAVTVPRLSRPLQDLPSIDTSLTRPDTLSRAESTLSPTKAGPDLAADARRERKVLDLEISNSSLMAINTSLEREVRRQKAELKRFRRLSRAGRFSFPPNERTRTISEDLSALPEEDEEDDYFGLAANSADPEDSDLSDDEGSLTSSAGPLSTPAQDRLAKDEKRLQVDLEKHKELLMQSQAMNQSIKRCTYATEDMIAEGKKALDYHVRISDVKLGGRVLSTHEDGQEIEVVDELVAQDDEVNQPKNPLDPWLNLGNKSLEGSDAGDRDSGIDVDQAPSNRSMPLASKAGSASDSGRPPGLIDLGRFGSFS